VFASEFSKLSCRNVYLLTVLSGEDVPERVISRSGVVLGKGERLFSFLPRIKMGLVAKLPEDPDIAQLYSALTYQ